MPSTSNNVNARHITNETEQNNIHRSETNDSVATNNDSVVFRDGTNSTNTDSVLEGVTTNNDDEEPIAPIRPPIHSKTKNWYSGFCNRWASLLGVS